MAVIHAEQDKSAVKQALADGRIKALRNVPPLDDGAIDRASRIVGMMGPEPFIARARRGRADRARRAQQRSAPWAACAMRAQLPPAPAWYAGKMLECGATASLPKGHDCLIATVREDGVEVEPINPIRRCTPLSVANHSLHEKCQPVLPYRARRPARHVRLPLRCGVGARGADQRHALGDERLHGQARRRRAGRLSGDHDLRHARSAADRRARRLPGVRSAPMSPTRRGPSACRPSNTAWWCGPMAATA